MRLVQPSDGPDPLAEAVLNCLTRPIYTRLSWGAPLTFIMALVTLGIVPVVAMLGWLRGLIAQHQQQLWHLAEWLRLETGDTNAALLQKAAERIRLKKIFTILSITFVSAAASIIIGLLATGSLQWQQILSFGLQPPTTGLQFLFSVLIIAAAICNWLQQIWHQMNMHRFLNGFNAITEKHGLEQIELKKPVEHGLGVVWIIGGLILALQGAYWGLPVMLAAGAHRRYTSGQSVILRGALAERLRAILLARRPVLEVPGPAVPARVCHRSNCRAPLSSIASFCPRCGTRVSRWSEVVA